MHLFSQKIHHGRWLPTTLLPLDHSLHDRISRYGAGKPLCERIKQQSLCENEEAQVKAMSARHYSQHPFHGGSVANFSRVLRQHLHQEDEQRSSPISDTLPPEGKRAEARFSAPLSPEKSGDVIQDEDNVFENYPASQCGEMSKLPHLEEYSLHAAISTTEDRSIKHDKETNDSQVHPEAEQHCHASEIDSPQTNDGISCKENDSNIDENTAAPSLQRKHRLQTAQNMDQLIHPSSQTRRRHVKSRVHPPRKRCPKRRNEGVCIKAHIANQMTTILSHHHFTPRTRNARREYQHSRKDTSLNRPVLLKAEAQRGRSQLGLSVSVPRGRLAIQNKDAEDGDEIEL